jgi:hypothetical protein
MFDGLAAWPMAGLTVDQGQTGLFRDLVTVNRTFEVRVDFVVLVAAGETVLVAYVVGFQVTNQNGFVVFDRCDRLR